MDISKDVNYGVDMSVLSGAEIVQVPDSMGEWTHQFQEAMMMYNCAIREVKTRLEVLNDELSVRNKRNPIELIKSRVKRPISIIEKLQRRGYPISLSSMMENLDDVAGVRVICPFVDDIYDVADMLMRVIFCLFGNKLYFRFVLKSLRRLRAHSEGELRREEIFAAGGVRILNSLLVVVMSLALTFVSMYGTYLLLKAIL